MTRTPMTIIATVGMLQDEPAMIAYVRERLFAAAKFPGLPLERVGLDANADRIEFSVQHYDDPQAWLAEMLRRERIIAAHDRLSVGQEASDMAALQQRVAKLEAALSAYADEDNWGQSANEDWDRWQLGKHGYRTAQAVLAGE